MSQKLILPFRGESKVTAGWKCTGYSNYMKTAYGLNHAIHYGQDCKPTNNTTTIYASGDGKVINFGEGPACGKIVIIQYDSVYNHVTGQTYPTIIARYFHLDTFDRNLKVGMPVTISTVLGQMGGSGKYGGGATNKHLHLEFDTDAKYPAYTPTLVGSDGILRAGTDSTIGAASILHIKQSAPENQRLVGKVDNVWVRATDISLPLV